MTRFALVLVLCIAVTLAFTGCVDDEEPVTEPVSVALVIDYAGVIMDNGVSVTDTLEVEMTPGSTAFDLLNAHTTLNYTEDPLYGAFVTHINNVGNVDGKYWMFYVNGEMASVGISAYVLNDNDLILMRLEAASW